MSERYSRTFLLQGNLYAEGAPVILEAGALLSDVIDHLVLAQLKFSSVSSKNISSLTVEIIPQDENGRELVRVPFQYSNLHVTRTQEFGSQVPIYLTDVSTRSFSVRLTEAVFEDYSVWNGENSVLVRTALPSTLEQRYSDPNVVKQFRLEYGKDKFGHEYRNAPCSYAPLETAGLWYCTCGALNQKAEETCWKCGRELKVLLSLTEADLSSRAAERLEQERIAAEKARLEQEERARQDALAREAARQKAEEEKARRKAIKAARARKAGKILAIVFASLAGAAAVACLVIFVAIPKGKYDGAVKLEEQGDYESAITAFESLGSYKDSAEQITFCQNSIAYEEAETLENDRKYEEAMAAFKALGDFSDASAKAEECLGKWNEARYREALSLMEQGDYQGAKAKFQVISDYSDSAEKMVECDDLQYGVDYQTAMQAMDSQDYATAVSILETLKNSGYEDSAAKYSEAAYDYAIQLKEAENYAEAVSWFEKVNDLSVYEGAEAALNDCRYANAQQLVESSEYEEAIRQLDALPEEDARRNDEVRLSAEYGYVTTHEDADNTVTREYLIALKEAGYSDSAAIYQELYGWHITVDCVNDAEWSSTNMTTISKYSTIFFHITLSGGEPGASTLISFVTIWPNGSTNEGQMEFEWESGESGYVYSYYNTPAYGATGTLTTRYYDGDGNLIGEGSVQIVN